MKCALDLAKDNRAHGRSLLLAADLSMQPGARERPFILDGCRRQVHGRGGLVNAEAGEVSKRNDLGFSRVNLFEIRQRLIERDQVRAIVIGLLRRYLLGI